MISIDLIHFLAMVHLQQAQDVQMAIVEPLDRKVVLDMHDFSDIQIALYVQ